MIARSFFCFFYVTHPKNFIDIDLEIEKFAPIILVWLSQMDPRQEAGGYAAFIVSRCCQHSARNCGNLYRCTAWLYSRFGY